MRKNNSVWVFLIMILSGALIGGFIGELLAQYSFFSWMSFGSSNGYRELFSFSFNPLIDTTIIRLGLSMNVNINAGSIVGMLLSLIIYLKR